MRNLAYAFVLALLAQTAACSYGYRATGRLDGMEAPLAGKADLRNSGGGHFTLSSPNNDLMCDGIAEPPDPAPPPQSGCAGLSGKGHMRCSDGRYFTLTWTSLTCRAFEGTGSGPDGNTMHFSVRRERY